MSVLSRSFSIDAAAGADIIIILDRWSSPELTIQFVTLTDNVSIEGTTSKINQDETPDWNFLIGLTTASLNSNVVYDGEPTAPGFAFPVHQPLEAIRITANSGTATGRLIQADHS